jgi:DNA polymerase-3 subunit alpha
MYDFCLRSDGRDMNRRALEGLVKSGALDGLEQNRRQMLQNIDAVLAAVAERKRYTGGGQLDLFGDGQDSAAEFRMAPCEELSTTELLKMEKEVTGLYLSGHPMKNFEKYVNALSLSRINSLTPEIVSDGQKVSLAAIVSSKKEKTTKSNSQLCNMVLEDMTGTINAVAFGKVYSFYKPTIAEGKVYKITATVSERDDRPIELIIEKMEAITEAHVASVPDKKEQKLYIRVGNISDPRLQPVKTVLQRAPKKAPLCRTFIFTENDRKTLLAPQELWVSESAVNGLLEELSALAGEGNVRLV